MLLSESKFGAQKFLTKCTGGGSGCVKVARKAQPVLVWRKVPTSTICPPPAPRSKPSNNQRKTIFCTYNAKNCQSRSLTTGFVESWTYSFSMLSCQVVQSTLSGSENQKEIDLGGSETKCTCKCGTSCSTNTKTDVNDPGNGSPTSSTCSATATGKWTIRYNKTANIRPGPNSQCPCINFSTDPPINQTTYESWAGVVSLPANMYSKIVTTTTTTTTTCNCVTPK